MGKAFIKLGLWIQKIWRKFQCNWNHSLSYITFKVIDTCPNKLCTCSHEKECTK